MDAKGPKCEYLGQSHWLDDVETMRKAARRKKKDVVPNCSSARTRNAKQDGTSCAVNEDPRKEDLSVVEDDVLDASEKKE